jgi:hypothetical protein
MRAKKIAQKLVEFIESKRPEEVMDFYFKRDTDGSVTLTVGQVRPLWWEVSLLVSEAIHHLRTALDHIAWQVSYPDADAERDVCFPIHRKPRDFRKSVKKCCPGAKPEVIELLKGYQPFLTSNVPQVQHLWTLAKLNNHDKHREMLACATAIDGGKVTYEVEGEATAITTEAYSGELKPGTVLSRATLDPSNSNARLIAHYRFKLSAVFHPDMEVQGAEQTSVSEVSIVPFLWATADLIESEITPTLKDHFRE